MPRRSEPEAYVPPAYKVGDIVRIRLPKKTADGTVEEIAKDGSLTVRVGDRTYKRRAPLVDLVRRPARKRAPKETP